VRVDRAGKRDQERRGRKKNIIYPPERHHRDNARRLQGILRTFSEVERFVGRGVDRTYPFSKGLTKVFSAREERDRVEAV